MCTSIPSKLPIIRIHITKKKISLKNLLIKLKKNATIDVDDGELKPSIKKLLEKKKRVATAL